MYQIPESLLSVAGSLTIDSAIRKLATFVTEWYTAVQTSGISGPHVRSRPWQGVTPQSALPGFPGVTITGTVVALGFPSGKPVVQPETSNEATRTMTHIPGMKNSSVT